MFDGVIPIGDVPEKIDEPIHENGEEPPMDEEDHGVEKKDDEKDGYANVRDTTRLVEDLEAAEGVEDHPRTKNESPVGVEGDKSAYVDGNEEAGVREPEDAHSTKDKEKEVASPASGRTPELRKMIRSDVSRPRDGSLPNATVRESTLSKPTNPIRGLADVTALREIFFEN